MENRLTDREELILRTLVEIHIKTAEPVSSGTLSKLLDIRLSPATIRNILAGLEEKKMLEKPHTSAGRIPTDNGYQYYVDYLMRPVELTELDRRAIRDIVSNSEFGIFDMLESIARVLARLTNQLGVVIAPLGEDLRLRRIDVVALGSRKLFLILTTTDGFTRRLTLELRSEIDARRLTATCAIINDRLSGLTLGDIRKTIRTRLADVLNLRDVFIARLVGSADSIFRFTSDGEMHFYGTSRLLDQPEFRDFSRLKAIISLLENPDVLKETLTLYAFPDNFNVRVSRFIEGVTIVSEHYETRRGRGIVSIVGPPRMDYARMVSVLSYARQSLSGVFGV